jgi:transcriptional regulator with XRE-family HTH domain
VLLDKKDGGIKLEQGSRFKLLRILSGISQEYVGDLVGLKQKSISHLESGKKRPTSTLIKILSTFYGC